MPSGEALQSPIVWHPLNAAEAWNLKQTYGADSVYISGGTLLRTQWEAGVASVPKYLIDLSRIPGASSISLASDELSVGAQSTLATIRNGPYISTHVPLLTDAVRQIAAPSIRNQASIGGNIASRVGDALPALLVYNASLVWQDGVEQQTIELDKWLLQHQTEGDGREAARLLLNIQIPLPPTTMPNKRFNAYYKIGRREVFTPSVVTVALNGHINEQHTLTSIRIAAGGGQTIARRLIQSEALLEGKTADLTILTELYESVLEEYEPVGDVFAGIGYRKQTAANLIATEFWKLVTDWEEKE